MENKNQKLLQFSCISYYIFVQSAQQNFVFNLNLQQADTLKKKKKKHSCPKTWEERNIKEYRKLYELEFDLKEEQLREGQKSVKKWI